MNYDDKYYKSLDVIEAYYNDVSDLVKESLTKYGLDDTNMIVICAQAVCYNRDRATHETDSEGLEKYRLGAECAFNEAKKILSELEEK